MQTNSDRLPLIFQNVNLLALFASIFACVTVQTDKKLND